MSSFYKNAEAFGSYSKINLNDLKTEVTKLLCSRYACDEKDLFKAVTGCDMPSDRTFTEEEFIKCFSNIDFDKFFALERYCSCFIEERRNEGSFKSFIQSVSYYIHDGNFENVDKSCGEAVGVLMLVFDVRIKTEPNEYEVEAFMDSRGIPTEYPFSYTLKLDVLPLDYLIIANENDYLVLDGYIQHRKEKFGEDVRMNVSRLYACSQIKFRVASIAEKEEKSKIINALYGE